VFGIHVYSAVCQWRIRMIKTFMHHSKPYGSDDTFYTKTSVFNMIPRSLSFLTFWGKKSVLILLFQILDTNKALFFHLQQQRFIELVRHGRIGEALAFAQEELAPRGEDSPEFLAELERTMALLAFDTSTVAPPAISELLSPAQRMRTAGEVNAAILDSLSQAKEVKLVGLMKLLCWGGSLLEEQVEFPQVCVCALG
jgi:hypothetical protein